MGSAASKTDAERERGGRRTRVRVEPAFVLDVDVGEHAVDEGRDALAAVGRAPDADEGDLAQGL